MNREQRLMQWMDRCRDERPLSTMAVGISVIFACILVFVVIANLTASWSRGVCH